MMIEVMLFYGFSPCKATLSLYDGIVLQLCIIILNERERERRLCEREEEIIMDLFQVLSLHFAR